MTSYAVSIIIPCYNAEAHVGEAIQSALDQTYPDKEVIVIDDGSTDGSLNVIRSFGDEIRWESGPNRGGCAARNRGLELAGGEFIQFLDADDLLKSEKLARQVPIAIDHPETLTYCDYERRSLETGETMGVHSRDCQSWDPVAFALRTPRLATQTPLHRTEWLRQIGGFRTELPCAQEYDLHIRLACCGHRFFHVPEVLSVVRQCGRSVSSDSVRVLDQHADILWNAFHQLELRGHLTQKHDALAGQFCSDARAYLQHGYPDRAAAYFAEAARLHPSKGIDQAYGRITRVLLGILGPMPTERLVAWKRRVFNQTATVNGRRQARK